MTRYVVLCFVVAVVAAGCASPPYQIRAAAPGSVSTAKVELLDKAPRKALRLVSHEVRRVEGDLLQVRLKFKNVKRKPLWFDVRVTFLADDGSELESTNWRPVQFVPGMATNFTENSLSATAASYVVRMREPVVE